MIIPFANIIKRTHLAQDDSELCTKMNVVLIGDFQVGGAGEGEGLPMSFENIPATDPEPHDYLPAPITIEAEHPDHDDWRHERVTAIDPRLDVFKRPEDIATEVDYDFPGAEWTPSAGTVEACLLDETTTDYLNPAAVNVGFIFGNIQPGVLPADSHKIVGVKINYKITLKTDYNQDYPTLEIFMIHAISESNIDASSIGVSLAASSSFSSEVKVALPATPTEEIYTKWIYFPWHALQSPEFSGPNLSSSIFINLNTDNLNATTDFTLNYCYPLIVDTERLQDYAESFIKLPTPIPQSVEVLGYVQGDGRTATIEDYGGIPDNDQILEVRQITRYPARSPTGTTVIDLGALSDEVRKQKFFKEKQKETTTGSINRVAGGSRVKY